MLIGTDLYYIINGLCLLFLLPSSLYFWKFIIDYEKEKNNKSKENFL